MKAVYYLKVILAVIIGVSLNIFLRATIYPAEPPLGSNLEQSIVVKNGLLIPVFILYATIIYSLLAIVFERIKKYINGSTLKKCIIYGFSFFGLWVIGMLESCSLFGNPFIYELLSGIIDGLPIFIMCILLGLLNKRETQNNVNNKRNFSSILIIALTFIIGRIIGYYLLRINSGISSRPALTMIWTIAMGLWIGFIYFLIYDSNPNTNYFKKAIQFAVIIYGSDIFLFNFTIALIIQVSIYDLILRTILDILFVTIGIIVYGKILTVKRQNFI
jgi:hypothetical protein